MTSCAVARRRGLAVVARVLLVALVAACGDAGPSHAVATHAAEGAAVGSAAARARRPNVLLVCLDTLRADGVGFGGATRDTTPFLDDLAAQGRVFTRCYSAYPRTLSSVASLFTGLDPTAHGTIERPNLPVAAVTLAERFAAAGWATCAVVTNPHLSPGLGFDQGFATYVYVHGSRPKSMPQPAPQGTGDGTGPGAGASGDTADGSGAPDVRVVPSEGSSYYGRGDAVNAAALAWLDEPREQPFLLYLHYMDVHNPYVSPEPYHSTYVEEQGRDLYCRGMPPPDVDVQPRDVAYMRALYDGQIRYVDALLAELTDALAARELLDATLLVLLSDHGEEFFERGGFGHGTTLYDELLHVPLLVWGPGVVEPGRSEEVVSLVDVAPTLCALYGLGAAPRATTAGAAPIPGAGDAPRHGPLGWDVVQGHSVAATFTAGPGTGRDAPPGARTGPPEARALSAARPGPSGGSGDDWASLAFAECVTARDAANAWRPQLAAIGAAWSMLHRAETGETELYRRAHDPRQLRNVADSHGEEVARLLGLLERRRQRSRAIAELLATPALEYDAEIAEQLRALGYVR